MSPDFDIDQEDLVVRLPAGTQLEAVNEAGERQVFVLQQSVKVKLLPEEGQIVFKRKESNVPAPTATASKEPCLKTSF